ncbi:hypothetical protein KC348_g62 [Hortaea werneckii]|nr:hypothetical protein KC348_g62 [Hortaea werneckii]
MLCWLGRLCINEGWETFVCRRANGGSCDRSQIRKTWLVKLGWEEAGSWGLCSLGAHLLIARFAVKLHTHTFNVVCRCAGTWSMCWQVRQQIIEERGKKASVNPVVGSSLGV